MADVIDKDFPYGRFMERIGGNPEAAVVALTELRANPLLSPEDVAAKLEAEVERPETDGIADMRLYMARILAGSDFRLYLELPDAVDEAADTASKELEQVISSIPRPSTMSREDGTRYRNLVVYTRRAHQLLTAARLVVLDTARQQKLAS